MPAAATRRHPEHGLPHPLRLSASTWPRASAGRRAKAHDVPNLLYVQGNLLAPPLAKHAFDFAYSFGVLHHTRAPRAAFLALVASSCARAAASPCSSDKDFSDLPLKKAARWRR